MSVGLDPAAHKVIDIACNIAEVSHLPPGNEFEACSRGVEKHLQNRYQKREGKDIEYCGQNVQQHRTAKVANIRPYISFDYFPEANCNIFYFGSEGNIYYDCSGKWKSKG